MNPETQTLLQGLAAAARANEDAFDNGHPHHQAMAKVGRDYGYLYAEAHDEVRLHARLEQKLSRALAEMAAFVEQESPGNTATRTKLLDTARQALLETRAAETRQRPDPFALMRDITQAHENSQTSQASFMPWPALASPSNAAHPMVARITEAMARTGSPLSEHQQLVLAGNLAMWLETKDTPVAPTHSYGADRR
jgi:hypothetical protein